MEGNGNSKHYDLEERTYEFARDVRGLVELLYLFRVSSFGLRISDLGPTYD